MRSEYLTVGKDKWQRSYFTHTGSGGIEKTILSLLDSLKNIDHAEYMEDTTDIVTLMEFEDMRERVRKELYACLA